MRCPPRRFLSRTWLARIVITLQLPGGWVIRCRVNEFIAFVEVFVLRDYEVQGLDWRSLRSVVDVGANVGMATVWFARRAPNASILAVEPAPDALSLLRSNLDSTDLWGRVRVLQVALGPESGTGRLFASGASVEAAVMFEASASDIGQPVSVVTLAQVLSDQKLSSVDLLKLDCEGAEFSILASAEPEVLDRVHTIIGEYHQFQGNNVADLKAELESRGFDVDVIPHPRELTLGRFVARRLTT